MPTATASATTAASATATSPRRPHRTISIIAGCSGGIEPLFAVAFVRNQASVMMPDVNEDVVPRARAEG